MEQVDNEYTQQLNDMISLGESLERLKKNRDFKRLILDMYLKDGSDILTRNLTRVNDKELLFEQFKARSWLYDHLDRIEDDYNTALETYQNLQGE